MNKNKKARPHRYPAQRDCGQGFTVIEILIIIAIIGILVSVVLVSLMSGRDKAQDNSAFTSFKSLAAPAYMCLTSGENLTLPNINYNICSNPNAVSGSIWPEFVRTGWNYDDFLWCAPNLTYEFLPSSCGVYNNGTCGGDNGTGNFCFGVKKGSKSMWCTINGCRKEGF
jgi:type II secretory pathway pseudopilin PulG